MNAPGGGAACVNDCNTGATPGPDFAGANCQDMPNSTVWYSVTTDANTATLDINLTSSDMTSPEFVIFSTTDCTTYTTVHCNEGSGGAASSTGVPVSTSTTYLIAVSNVSGSSGSFDLCVTQNVDASACNTNSSIVATATSMGSPLTGPYLPGEQITFCYNLTDWEQVNCNYIGAFVPTFGDCWDPTSFDADGMPVNISSPLNVNGVIQATGPPGPAGPQNPCAGEAAGSWQWFTAGSATYNVNGYYPAGTPMPAGWYFLSSYDPATGQCTGNDPTDPDNSFGDGDYPSCGTNTFDYTLCFTLTVGPSGNCGSGTTDCSVSIKTFADGEFGAWGDIGCTIDEIKTIASTQLCCTPPVMTNSTTGAICSSENVNFTLTSDIPATFTWIATNNPNITGESLTNQNTALINDVLVNTTNVVQTVTYTVTPTGTTPVCAGAPETVTITVNPVPAVPTITSVAPTCAADGTSTISNYDGTLTYVFTPTGPTVGAGGLISNMTVGTSYTVIGDNGSCQSTASASFSNAAMLITPAVPTINSVAPTCVADGTSTVSNYDGTLTYTVTPAGPTVGAGGAISGMTLGTSYTVTAANTDCTSAASASFSNLAQLSVPAVPTITSVAPTCAADGTSTISNYDGTLTYVFTPTGPTVGAGGLISNMAVGTSYTVIGDNGSCQSTASASFSNAAMLITPAVPTINSVAPTCVADGTSTVSNYDGTLTYTVTPAGPTVGAGGAISGMTLGTSYTVTAANTDCTSGASASFSNLAQLSVPAVPTITSVAPTCAADGTSTISNYDGTLTYVFTPTGPTVGAGGLISNMTVGTSYTVIGDNGSCQSTASASFSNAAMLITPAVPTITTVAPTCVADGTSTVSNYDGTLTYTVTPAGPTVGAGGAISGMTLGTSYTVTAANTDCTSAASASFSNLAQLSVPAVPTITSVAPTCAADGTSTISNYDGTLTYVFTPTGPTVGAGGLISNMTVGTSYTVIGDNGSCQSTASASFSNAAMLITPAVPTINSVAPTCVADGTSTVSNYDGTLTYTVTPAGPTVGAGGAISGMTLGTSYTVTAANTDCTSAASASFSNLAQLSVPAVPTITSVAPTCAADGTSTISNYDGTLTYVFTPTGPTVGAGGLISNMTVGTSYTVIGDNGSCQSTASASFSNSASLAITETPTASVTEQPSCANLDGTITVTSPTLATNEEYVLNGPDASGTTQINSTDGIFSNLDSGDYTLYISNTATGCMSSSITLTVNTMTIIPSFTISSACDGVDYTISVDNPNSSYTYSWYDSSGTLLSSGDQIIVTQADTYEVQASTGSCTTSEYITINNAFCSIPKGLSPNGDGLNDTWDLSNLDVKQVKIFNRYGTEVYSKADYTNEWDGTSKGNELPDATYYYVIWFNNNKTTTGWVYINR